MWLSREPSTLLTFITIPIEGTSSPASKAASRAAGTPVIVSNHGGLAELVEHNVSGLVFQPGNAADLAKQLQRIVDHPDVLADLRRGIPHVVTVREEMTDLTRMYHSVLSNVEEGVKDKGSE